MERKLVAVKTVHTVAWLFFASCVVALPFAAWIRRYDVAVALALCVLGESAVLALNSWRCPLTDLAARYTTDRRPNFDIYLPSLIARYNKEIFGSLFGAGLLFAIARFVGWLG